MIHILFKGIMGIFCTIEVNQLDLGKRACIYSSHPILSIWRSIIPHHSE